jgi:hypothetical protein
VISTIPALPGLRCSIHPPRRQPPEPEPSIRVGHNTRSPSPRRDRRLRSARDSTPNSLTVRTAIPAPTCPTLDQPPDTGPTEPSLPPRTSSRKPHLTSANDFARHPGSPAGIPLNITRSFVHRHQDEPAPFPNPLPNPLLNPFPNPLLSPFPNPFPNPLPKPNGSCSPGTCWLIRNGSR